MNSSVAIQRMDFWCSQSIRRHRHCSCFTAESSHPQARRKFHDVLFSPISNIPENLRSFHLLFSDRAARAIKPYYTRLEFQWRQRSAWWTWKREPKRAANDVIDGDIRQPSGTDRTSTWRQDERHEGGENVRTKGREEEKVDSSRKEGCTGCQVAGQHLT